jgi:murein DD-endopeptidase MepM/ murein hydrolase activator NlpD
MTRLLMYFALVFAVFTCTTSAFAIHADIQPRNVFPGDAFMVRLSDIAPSQAASVFIEGAEVPLEGCGEGCAFGIGAVEIDTTLGEKSVIINSGPYRLSLILSVRTPNFPEMRLKLPQDKVSLGPEDLARAKKEEEKLKEIWQQITPRLFQGDFMLPLPNPVSAVFGAKRIINDQTVSVHRGIDLRGKQGEQIRAANYGRTVLAEELFFGGNTLVIDHGAGIYTVYMHLDRFAVNRGDLVAKGDIIGFVGSTGRATGPHLHFGVKILSINTNPLSLMKLQISE